MSELVVNETSVETSSSLLSVLAAAGVAVGWLVSRLGAALLDEQPFSVNSAAQEFVKDAESAKQAFLRAIERSPQVQQKPRIREVAQVVARAQAIREAFNRQPLLALVAEAHSRTALPQAMQHALEAEAAFKRQNFDAALRAASRAETELSRSAMQALAQLREAQRQVVVQNVRTALGSLGFQVEEAARQQITAFWAKRGDQVLGVAVDDGQLVVDAAGFAGGKCKEAMNQLFEKLEAQGVKLKPRARYPHRRWAGGPLLNAGNGAQGLLAALMRLRTSQNPKHTMKAQRPAAAWIWQQVAQLKGEL
jgi:hypothetical protein